MYERSIVHVLQVKMKFVQRLEDTKIWRDNLEDSVKGKGNIEGSYYVVNQSGRGGSAGNNIEMIPAVATDIVVAKGKMRKGRVRKKGKSYKKGGKKRKNQSSLKLRGGRTNRVKKRKVSRRKVGKGRKRKTKKKSR